MCFISERVRFEVVATQVFSWPVSCRRWLAGETKPGGWVGPTSLGVPGNQATDDYVQHFVANGVLLRDFGASQTKLDTKPNKQNNNTHNHIPPPNQTKTKRR